MTLRLDAVLFDMDGLMIDTESLSGEAWRRAAQETGHAIPEEVILGMVGLSVQKSLDHIADYFGDRQLATMLSNNCRVHYRELMTHGPLATKPGIHAVLDWVQERELPRAVATSTQRLMCDLKLARTGLEKYFEHTVAGDEVANTKPAPDLYLAAASKLGIMPQHCVVLEDSLPGMRAALAAGMRVIVVPDLTTPPPEHTRDALAVCDDLFQALTILQSLPRH